MNERRRSSSSRTFLLWAAVGLLLTASPARAQGASSRVFVVPVVIGDGPAMLLPLILQSASLSDDQQRRIVQAMGKEGPAMRALLDQTKKTGAELAARLFGPGSSPAADVSTLTSHLAELRKQYVDHEIEVLRAVRTILTPKQRATVASFDVTLWEGAGEAEIE